jgi:dephospho-CoA kinase
VVVVACSPGVQLERLLVRGSIGPDAAAEMIKSQMPLGKKIKRADHVIWNNGTSEMLTKQTKLLVDLWRTEKWTKA